MVGVCHKYLPKHAVFIRLLAFGKRVNQKAKWRDEMKTYFVKWKLILLTAVMVWGFFSKTVHAEENMFHCYPTDEQIQAYKEDGTWEERQAYMDKLNHSTPSQGLLYSAIQRESGIAAYAAGVEIPEAWKGMQVTGDAKILLVRVEFADVKFENSKNYSEEEFLSMVKGDGSTENFPYESLNAYYKRSSYNKLNITSDKVYTCTLSKNRDEYEWVDTGEQELLKEVLGMLDTGVNFKDYDSNDDGRLDGICINFAGENTGWGSTWWSHESSFQNSSIMFDGVTPGNYIFLETYEDQGSYGTQTLIHETGHMLGLPDYYSRVGEGIGTTDMMNNNRGDHNGFSKWLLGWIEEKNIQRITRENGKTDVTLTAISSDSPGDNKLIAVIAPQDTSIYSEYFVVQYDEQVGNQAISEIATPRYRIFHVDAQLDEEETDFKYSNLYSSERVLIKAVSIVEGEYWEKRDYYKNGDVLTPDTEESSAFYGGNIMGFTGIEVTDFKTGDSPSFCVSFRDKEAVDGKLELQILGETPLNMAKLTLLSNKPLIDAASGQVAYYEDGDGNRYPVSLSLNKLGQIEILYTDIANSLKAETEYTLVIPAGMFQIDTDVYSEECRLEVKTGVFPEIDADFTYGIHVSTDMIPLDGKRSGFLQFSTFTGTSWIANMHLFEGTEEVDTIEVSFSISDQYDKYTEVTDMTGVACYDGTIVVEIRAINLEDYSEISCFYKIDQNGNVLAGPFMVKEVLETFPAGNGIKGIEVGMHAVGAPDIENESKLEVYTIDFQNEPVSCLINMDKYSSSIFALDEESYVVIQPTSNECLAGVYNNKDEQVVSMDLSPHISGTLYTAVKAGDKLAIIHGKYSEGDSYDVMVSMFDMAGTHLETREILTYTNWRDVEEWKIEKTSWGYTLSNYTQDSPHMFWFLDDEFNLFSSLQAPYMMSSGAHMGFRISMKWYDISVFGYRVAITEPIVEESTELEPDPEEPDEPETDLVVPGDSDGSTGGDADKNTGGKPVSGTSPSAEESSGTTTAPSTGDSSNLWLWITIAVVSGVVLLAVPAKKFTS